MPSPRRLLPPASASACSRMRVLALTVLQTVGAAVLLAGTAQSQALFPPACAVLQAHLQGEPAADAEPDTNRVQAALDGCATGQAVELTAAAGRNAFLLAPIRVPAGVTLLVDAGVTAYATPNPADYATGPASDESPCGVACRAWITVAPSQPDQPAGVMGFGTLDARGGTALREERAQPRTWFALPTVNRPALISAGDELRLSKITLRHAAADSLVFTGSDLLQLDGVKIINAADAGGTRGLVLTRPASRVTITQSTVSANGVDLQLAAPVLLDQVSLYAGGGLSPYAPGHSRCLASSTPQTECSPAALPRYVGEIFLSTAAATNLESVTTSDQVTATAVVVAPEGETAPAREPVLFYDGDHLLGSVLPVGGVASLLLPHLSPGDHRITAAYPDTLRFGPAIIHSLGGPDTAAYPSAFVLSANYPEAPLNTSVQLTATPNTGSPGTVTFFDGRQPLSTQPIAAGSSALFSTAALSQGVHTLTASFTDGTSTVSSNTVASNAVSVTIDGLPTNFSVVAPSTSVFAGNQFSLVAIGLPADATGSVTFTDGGVPLATTPIDGTSNPAYVALGDSLTSGDSLSDTAQRYPSLLAVELGTSLSDLAVGGFGACDVLPREILRNNAGPTQSIQPLYSLMIGTDDAGSLTGETAFKVCHQAALAWLAIPRDRKVLAGDPAVQILSGMWQFSGSNSLDDTFRTLGNNTGSGSARWPITTSGHPVYLWYLLDDRHPGTFSVTLDGVSTGTVYSVQLPQGTSTATGLGMALLRLPVAAGAHTVDVAVLSGSVGMLGVGSAPPADSSSVHPTVLVTDTPAAPAFPTGNGEQYSADAQADADLLRGDGLDLRFVRTRDFMLGSPAEMADSIHPNALGQQHLAAAFQSVLQGVNLSPYRGFVNAAPFTNVALTSAGVHALGASYAGDSVYQPYTASPLNVTVLDPATSVMLAASSTDLLSGTPVTLTATVSPAQATGSVQFVDDLSGDFGTVPVRNGVAIDTFILPTGQHTLRAYFHSDEGRSNADSAPLAVTMERPLPAVSLNLSAAAIPYGQSTPITVTVGPSSATGAVTLSDSALGVLGQFKLLNGTAVFNSPLLPAGDYALSVSYTGDAANGPQTSSPAVLHISQTGALLKLPAGPLTGVFGSPLTVHADLLTGTTPLQPPFPAKFPAAINQTTVWMGDSITAWWPLPLHNFGVAGEQAADMLRRFPAQVLGHGYERMILLAGANDILHTNNDTPTIMQSIGSMASQAAAAGIRVILCLATPLSPQGVDMNDRVRSLNAAITTYAQANGHLLVDYNAAVRDNLQFFGDGIHPDLNGYALMETQLAHTLLLPSGAVGLLDGTPVQVSASGTAEVPLPGLQAGTQAVFLRYAGDRNFLPVGASVGAVIAPAPTSASLQVQPLAGYSGTAAVLTAAVAATPQIKPTGAVNFTEGGVSLGSATLTSAGTAVLTTGNLSNGTHTFIATYTGEQNFSAAATNSATVSVRFVASTVSLGAPDTSFPYGTPIPLTAKLNPTGATGTVSFYDGTQLLSQQPVSNGLASFSAAALAVGTHTLTVRYSGDTYDDTSQSPVLTITVTPDATSLLLTGQPTNQTYGSPVTLTAALTPAAATGSITFQEGSAVIGQQTVSAGSASFSSTAFAVGTHTVTATYAGDGNNQSAASLPLTIAIKALPATLTLSSPHSTVSFGAPVTLQLAVTPAAATGTCALTDTLTGTQTSVPISNGSASFVAANLSTGIHTFTATYSGDSITAPASANNLQVVVQAAPTAVALQSLPATVNAGSPVLLSAAVTPSAATGTVLFRDSSAGVLGQARVGAGGIASLALSSLPVGSYSISAAYSGDSNDSASSSPARATQIILAPTSTTLSALPASVPYSTEITLLANVLPATLTGVITFYDAGSVPLGSAALASGAATLQLSSLPVGSHALRAAFSGDSLNAASISAVASLQIIPDTTATTVSLARNPVEAGTSAIFNVQVTGANAVPPTGTVTLRSGTRVLTSATLGNAAGSTAYSTVSFASAMLGIGSFPVTAFYSGDAGNTLSNSAATPVTLVVAPDTTAASLSLSRSHIPVQAAATVIATISAAPGLIPTGTVSFLLNGKPFATASLDGAGSAQANLPPQAIGTYTLTATYVPTGFFSAAAFAPQTLTVTAPLAIAFPSATLKATAASTGSATLVLTPLSNFAGAVSTACSSKATFLHCTVDAPAIVNGSPVNATVHVAVAKSLAALNAIGTRTLRTLCALLLPFLSRRRLRGSRLLNLALAGVLAAFAMAATGCATGGNFSSIPDGVQVVTVTVTAAGVSTSADLNVLIQDE